MEEAAEAIGFNLNCDALSQFFECRGLRIKRLVW